VFLDSKGSSNFSGLSEVVITSSITSLGGIKDEYQKIFNRSKLMTHQDEVKI